MNDNDFCVRQRATTSNPCTDVRLLVGGLHDAVVFKRRLLGRAQDGLIFYDSTRYDQRGFGEPITGIEEVWAEATRCEGRGKPFQSVRTDWLGPVVCHIPNA